MATQHMYGGGWDPKTGTVRTVCGKTVPQTQAVRRSKAGVTCPSCLLAVDSGIWRQFAEPDRHHLEEE